MAKFCIELCTNESLIKREYILHTSHLDRAEYASQSPQRMYCSISRNEFRLAGTFSEKLVVPKQRNCKIKSFAILDRLDDFLKQSFKELNITISPDCSMFCLGTKKTIKISKKICRTKHILYAQVRYTSQMI